MSGRGRAAWWGFLALTAGGLAAAPLARDLGQGLAYVRMRELPGDLPPQPAGPAPACVVDLRYTPASPDAAAAFGAWLKFRATARSPVLVLANRDTAPELRLVLRESAGGAGIVVIGIPGPGFAPDVAVRATPEEEKAAYATLDRDTPLAALLSDHPDKQRYDEASLIGAPAPLTEDGPAGATVPPARRVDATLQRAVHLHRALMALRRGSAGRSGG